MGTGQTFTFKENKCRTSFSMAGIFWHISSPEDFELFFRDEEDFKAGMTILAICAAQFSRVKIITFTLMSNHVHLVVLSEYDDAMEFFDIFRKCLFRHLMKKGRNYNKDSFIPDIRRINDLEHMRNAIAYDNRNAFVVSPNCTPMTYKWGAGKYFFNPDAQQRWKDSSDKLKVRNLRDAVVSRQMDAAAGMIMVDGCVCPMSFCFIKLGEDMFRDPAHYFNKLAKDIESSKEFAKEIGERVFYSDEELFSIVCSLSRSLYGPDKITTLPASNKIELAKKMHYEYNASNKQIIRMMKLDEGVVNSLFPKRM